MVDQGGDKPGRNKKWDWTGSTQTKTIFTDLTSY
jgi:hypothetical protein